MENTHSILDSNSRKFMMTVNVKHPTFILQLFCKLIYLICLLAVLKRETFLTHFPAKSFSVNFNLFVRTLKLFSSNLTLLFWGIDMPNF